MIAAEVEKYFETKVKPETVRKKAARISARTNVQQEENPIKSDTNPKLEKLEKLEKPEHGGAREGAGRKPKEVNGKTKQHRPAFSHNCEKVGRCAPLVV